MISPLGQIRTPDAWRPVRSLGTVVSAPAAQADTVSMRPRETCPPIASPFLHVPAAADRVTNHHVHSRALSFVTGAMMLGGVLANALAGNLSPVAMATPPTTPVASQSAAVPARQAPPVTLQAVDVSVVETPTVATVAPPAQNVATPETTAPPEKTATPGKAATSEKTATLEKAASAPAQAQAPATAESAPAKAEVPMPPKRPTFDQASSRPAPAAKPAAEKAVSEGKHKLELPEVPKSPIDKLADSLGVSSKLLESSSDTAISSLERLPGSVRTMYKNLDFRYKKLMIEKLHGSTSVLFTEISHKQAFIDGQAMGVDAFNKMHELVGESVQQGKIDGGTGHKLDQAIEAFRHMTREQRAAVVSLLERDVAHH